MDKKYLNILFITHKKPERILDHLYQGFMESGHKAYDFPSKSYYHKPFAEIPGNCDNFIMLEADYPELGLTYKKTRELLNNNFFSLIITTTKTFDYKGSFISDIIRWLKYRLPSKRTERGGGYTNKFKKFIKVPVIAVDGRDAGNIQKSSIPLLDKCNLYFKSEIPLNNELLFKDLDQQMVSIVKKNFHKLRPIPIGINLSRFNQIFPDNEKKTIDVAYLMAPENHPLRERVFAILSSMQNKYKMFLSCGGVRTGLKFTDYIKILKSSKIALSIAGNGCDCVRHYEVPACRSVLMVNEPTIHTYNFFEDGKSAIIFKNDLSDFEEKLDYYLKHEGVLSYLAENGYNQLKQFFDVRSMVKYVLESLEDVYYQT